MDNSVYTRINYETMLSGKKQVLATQINCLNILRTIDSYKALRKKEFMLKLKIKNNLKEIKESLAKINETMPKKVYDDVKQRETSNENKISTNESYMITSKKIGEKEDKLNLEKEFSIEQELLEIQKRLAHLN